MSATSWKEYVFGGGTPESRAASFLKDCEVEIGLRNCCPWTILVGFRSVANTPEAAVR